MTLPAIPAGADKRRHWGLAAAILLVVLAFGVTARAQEADPYAATVKVDATAASVVKAREEARVDGQRRALAKVLQRLSGSDSAATLPRLSDAAITDLVASFEVADERMSAVRYVADYTFHFRPAAIRKVLQNAGLPATGATASTGAGGPVTIIPVYRAGGETRLWNDPNPWREAWERLPATDSSNVKLVLPLGDIADIAAIDAPRAVSGDPGALTAIARRDHTDSVVVALAAPQGPPNSPTGVDVTVRRYRAGQSIDTHHIALTASPGESGGALLRRAAAAIAANLAGAWSAAPEPPAAATASLTAVLPIAGLEDWVRTRQRLSGVPAIRAVSLKALSQQAATIDIGYAGSIDALKTELAGIHLDLVGGAPLWHLARPGASPTP